VPAVTRTARRIRRTRAAVAVAAAVAVLAPAGLIVTSARHDEATSFAHSDVLTWPDRSLPEEQTVANGALAAVEQNAGTSVDDDLRWLYRGRVQLPDHNPAYLAVFTATLQAQKVLFTVSSIGTQLNEQGRGGLNGGNDLPWSIDRIVLGDGAVDHVGAYFGYTDPDGQFYNLAVLLADPRARTMTWDAAPIPFAPDVPGSSTVPAESTNGVFVTALGPLTGPVTTTVADRHGHRVTYPLASGGAHITLLKSAEPAIPSGSQLISGGSSDSEQGANGSWTMPVYSDGTPWPQKRRAVYVRCYGGGTVLFELRDAQGRARSSGRVACDNVSHQAIAPVEVTGAPSDVVMTPDRLQSITFAVVGLD